LKKYLVIIESSFTEHPYVLTIQEDGNTRGGMAWHKKYADEAALTQDLKGCLKAEDDKAASEILKTIADKNHWETTISLTDQCVARLGWRQ